MKKEGHPDYNFVVFKDAASEFQVLTRSSIKSKEMTKWEDGKEYPVVTMEITSASHPFYTGKQKILDTAGRVEKFRRKYGMFSKKSGGGEAEAAPAEKAAPAAKKVETNKEASAKAAPAKTEAPAKAEPEASAKPATPEKKES